MQKTILGELGMNSQLSVVVRAAVSVLVRPFCPALLNSGADLGADLGG